MVHYVCSQAMATANAVREYIEMRVYLDRKVKASYEMVRSFCAVLADGRSHWFKFDSDTLTASVHCYPYSRRYTVIFCYTGKGTGVHTRTAKNPVTLCDTLAALGITSFDMLINDDPKSRKAA